MLVRIKQLLQMLQWVVLWAGLGESTPTRAAALRVLLQAFIIIVTTTLMMMIHCCSRSQMLDLHCVPVASRWRFCL